MATILTDLTELNLLSEAVGVRVRVELHVPIDMQAILSLSYLIFDCFAARLPPYRLGTDQMRVQQ